ncbi:MAG: F0F1 ATP synthase subunit delta, partial [Candidatus Omnitrophica bacterium]|nr:F0F1 ATP synthase subunit delta [Candidatus Omnitrophota bacterium]
IFIQDVIRDLADIDVSRFKVDADHGALIMASPIDAALKDQIVQILSRKTGKTIVLDGVVDEKLIAGIVVKLGNLAIDASLQGRLIEASEGLKA